jgi:hypothetical protein
VVALVGGVTVLAVMVELLRRRQLKEKYAVLWVAVSVVVAALAIFPRLVDDLSGLLGILYPPDLLFFLAMIVLLLVSVHLSWETSRLEDETRALAEELAILRQRIEQGRIADE